jgi:predicted nucleotidyltransferase
MTTPTPPLDLARLLQRLDAHDVAFVVVGGLAALAHGARRMTLDLDIVPSPEPENFRRLADAVADLGMVEETSLDGGFQQIDPQDEVDLARSRNVSLRTSAGQLDVLNRARDAPPYDELAARAVRLAIAGVDVLVAGLDDLVAMKLASARPKDLQDVADVTAHEAGEYPLPPERA